MNFMNCCVAYKLVNLRTDLSQNIVFNSIEDFEVVGRANNKFHLRLKEALLIGVVKPTIINVQKKSLPLCLFGG